MQHKCITTTYLASFLCSSLSDFIAQCIKNWLKISLYKKLSIMYL